MVIDETILLLSRLEDCSEYRLAKYISGNLVLNTPMGVNYVEPLKQVFSRVIHYDYTRRIPEIGVTGINEELIALVRNEHPKYVAWVSTTYEFLGSTFDAIRKEGSTVVFWFGDDEYRFSHYCKWWLPHLDYCITFDPESVPKYRALGARPIFAFTCEGIPVERDWSKVEEKYDVSFVGRRDKSKRRYYINEIMKRNISVHLFGRGWQGGYVTPEEMTDIFTTSKISLNFSGTANRMGIKGRITTVCLAGGFLLTEYVPGIEDYFVIDQEIVCFKNAEEMIEEITYYLSHDEERLAIARTGWQRAMKEYTPFHMHSRVFNEIEEDIAAGGKKSDPVDIKMPILVRNSPSQFYFQWGRAYLEEGYEDFWKDALALSLSFNPLNISARYYYFIGSLPSFLRPIFFKLYLPFRATRMLFGKVLVKLLIWADSMPMLKNLKRSVSKRLHYS